MSTNRFAKFAAGGGGGGGGGGWLTTKKPGKDDARIRRDAQKAWNQRKAAKQKKRKAPASRKKKHDDDDEDDVDGFVVDDDEEIEEYSGDSSSEEEIEAWSKNRRSKSAAAARGKARSSKSASSDVENSSDSEAGTFFGSFPKRTSRPPPSMRNPQNRKQVKSAKNGRVKETVSLLSSEDEKSPINKKKPNLGSLTSVGTFTKKNPSCFVEEKKDESTDDNSSVLDMTGGALASRQTSSYFSATSKVPALAAAAASSRHIDTSEADTPFKVRKPQRKKIFDNSSSSSGGDDDASRGVGSDAGLDSCKDEDERLAIELAIKRSAKEAAMNGYQPKRLKKKSDSKSRKKKRRKVVAELSDDNEEADLAESSPEKEEPVLSAGEEVEEEEQEAYDQDGAHEASAVLDAANDLSTKIVQAMAGWCKHDGGESIPSGIIVDGALSISQCIGNPSSHSWISQEVMQKVCPQITLADYQLIGVNWLALLHGMTCTVKGSEGSTNVNGVLADEMGLGKTVQTIAFLAWLRHQHLTKQKGEIIDVDDDSSPVNNDAGKLADSEVDKGRPHLIVVPSSVLSNWEREFERFCPDMHVYKYHGTLSEREDIKEELRQYLPGARRRTGSPPLDVILTTYSYFSSEKADDRNFLRKFKYDFLVCDEGHLLKNSKGIRYRTMDKFATAHRLLLTGTPVQNSPQELMSLLCFLMPLFSRTKNADWDADDDDDHNDGGQSMLRYFVSLEAASATKDEATESAYQRLKQLFAPFVLRRRKDDVLHQIIPPKTRKLELVPFCDAMRQVYDSILATHINSRENPSVGAATSAQQHLFTSLRKAANHVLLLRTRHTSEEAMNHLTEHFFKFGYFGFHETCTKQLVKSELESFSDFDIHVAALTMIEENPHRKEHLARYILQEEDLFASPKFARLRTLLPDLISEGHRVLIFSQWTSSLDLLGCLLDSLNLSFLRLDGQTAITERQKLIDRFNQDDSIPVFLLSTRAGGMGINLTAADVCILHDLDFNPFNDAQAEDRLHRVGQTKPVTVIKMVTAGTVDEDIYRMQQRKAKMNEAILETKSRKKEEKEEINKMIQSAVNRFLHDPDANEDNSGEEGLVIVVDS